MIKLGASLILHPVRLRIVQTLAPDRRLLVTEIGERLRDIPPATLYRNVKRLEDAGVLCTIEERRRNRTLERVFQLARHAAIVDPVEFGRASRHDHLRYFTTFLATLIAQYARYLQRDRLNIVADGVGYRQVPLELSDDELGRLTKALNAAVLPFLAHRPSAKRKRRLFTTILIPDDASSREKGN